MDNTGKTTSQLTAGFEVLSPREMAGACGGSAAIFEQKVRLEQKVRVEQKVRESAFELNFLNF